MSEEIVQEELAPHTRKVQCPQCSKELIVATDQPTQTYVCECGLGIVVDPTEEIASAV
jgi:DNA-directed RNA polymerase subunit RPC12/RpoP